MTRDWITTVELADILEKLFIKENYQVLKRDAIIEFLFRLYEKIGNLKL